VALRFLYRTLVLSLFILPLTSTAAEVGLSAGLFKFPATDYYYPNFYDEARFREYVGKYRT